MVSFKRAMINNNEELKIEERGKLKTFWMHFLVAFEKLGFHQKNRQLQKKSSEESKFSLKNKFL